jgi:hypothetical protein
MHALDRSFHLRRDLRIGAAEALGFVAHVFQPVDRRGDAGLVVRGHDRLRLPVFLRQPVDAAADFLGRIGRRLACAPCFIDGGLQVLETACNFVGL